MTTNPNTVTVKAKYLRHSARKLAPMLKLVRGKKLTVAIDQTSVWPQQSAQMVNKLLKSAASAAEAKEFNRDELIVTELMASNGPKVKRIRANARGRANRYIKHLAHLKLVVGPAIADKTPVRTEEPTTQEAKAKTVTPTTTVRSRSGKALKENK